MQRRLAAIVAWDVVGYSRLMERDEEGTLARLNALRREVVDPHIARYGGRTVKLVGDGALAEFGSIVGAVQCAVGIQTAVVDRNADEPVDRALWLRIGINLGDVIVDGDDIYGDGVNIAARLEGQAEPGGICVADDAYRQIRGRVDAEFRDGGEISLKNIATPVRAWHWKPASGPVTVPLSAAPRGPATPDRPSIVVLPFANLSGDPQQDYFADGLTEDVISGLSRFPGLFVIGRGSSFIYKNKAVRPQDLCRELGVRYVAQGSVRRLGQRVRVTIELVEAESGTHLWGERYDRQFDDLFEVVDDITQRVCATLPGRVQHAEAGRLARKRTDDMAAYDYMLRAKLHFHRNTAEDNAEAQRLFDKVIELDPNFAEAYAEKACALGQALYRGYSKENAGTLVQRGRDLAQRGLSIDPNNVECHRILCEIAMLHNDWDRAELHHQRAFALNPNDPRIVAQRGELLTWLGRAEDGVTAIEQAMRLDPYEAPARSRLLGRALFACRRYADAVAAFKQVPAPGFAQYADLAACHAALGDRESARQAAAEVLRINPTFSVASYGLSLHYRRADDWHHHRDALLGAGLPP